MLRAGKTRTFHTDKKQLHLDKTNALINIYFDRSAVFYPSCCGVCFTGTMHF